MKLDYSSSGLVIVGGWNGHIFHPEWIKRYLFPSEEKEFQIEMSVVPNLNPQFAFPRISSTEVRMLLQVDRLNITPVKEEDEGFYRVEEVALQLADCLPHTPVTAYGVNFVFLDDTVDEDILDFIRPNDLAKIKHFGAALVGEEYTHRLKLKGHTLNLTIGIEEKKVSFKLNFHFQIRDLVAFKEGIFKTSILELKQEAIKFISEVYSLEVEGASE